MGYNKPDLYFQPEKFGLVPIGEVNDSESCYSFDDLVVWHHPESNTLYWAIDAGCSCPSPFEYFTSLDDATQVHFDNEVEMAKLEKAIREHCNYTLYEGYGHKEIDEESRNRANLLQAIRELAEA